MKRTDKILKIFATALFPLAAAIFFLKEYPNHLRFQEMTQLFESGWGYFLDVCSVPGGLADYIGRFLTQFFLYPAAGAAIIGVMLLLLQRSVWSVLCNRSQALYWLSFIPLTLAWVFLCNENATLGALAALVIALACARAVLSITDQSAMAITLLIASPVLYWICGPLAIVFVLATLRQSKPWTGIAATALVLLSAILSEHICQIPLQRLIIGIHYLKYRNVFPLWIWSSAIASVILCSLPVITAHRRILTSACAVLALATLALPFRMADRNRERTMRFAVLAVDEHWDDIIAEADKSAPRTYTAIRCLNLAIGKQGLLPQRMFHYVQEGPECLVSDITMDFVSDIVTAQVYRHLSLINTAQHFAFEAQENLPDFQKSSACYKILARTAEANSQTELASRYLKALGRTLLHRSWAREFLQKTESGQTQRQQAAGNDYFFLYDKMASTLGLLYTRHPDNRIALDYLLAYTLSVKDLNSFVTYLPMAGYDRLPKNWQEAWLLDVLITGGTLDEVSENVEKGVSQRLESFMKDYFSRAGTDHMLKEYSDTYWFYHFYRFNNE